ncbi:MAG: prenyltransferase/squalene oxidase repeat-containing protein [Phycisphaerae bacterium]
MQANRISWLTPLRTLAISAAVAGLIVPTAPTAQAQQDVGATTAPTSNLPEEMSPEVVAAVNHGLKYLASAQRPDGSWLNNGSYGSYPAVMTALSGLAFMAGGSTPESGPYAREVRKAMLYLIKIAEASDEGLISQSGSRTMYGHGFGTLFLASCYGTELNKEHEARLRKVLDRAVEVIKKAQSRKTGQSPGGGWYYGPTDYTRDEGSVTVTQLQAIRAARTGGIKIPNDVITRAVQYLKFCQMDDGGICYSATSRGGSRPAISAAAIACFYSAGIYDRSAGGRDGEEARMVEKLVKYVRGKVHPTPGGGYGGYYFYTQFYMSQVEYVQGGDQWKKYYKAISAHLLKTKGLDGSWNGDNIGTTYGTAIACFILQLPYGYVPFAQR